MRYILNYRIFEGAISNDNLSKELANSKAIKDMQALYPGDVVYTNSIGGVIRFSDKFLKIKLIKGDTLFDNKWSLFDKEQSFNNLEEALRYVWAQTISVKLRNILKKKDTFDTLFNSRKYWNEHKTLMQILKSEYPNLVGNIDNDILNVNNKLRSLGLEISSRYEESEFRYDCRIGITIEENALPGSKKVGITYSDVKNATDLISRLKILALESNKNFRTIKASAYTKDNTIVVKDKNNIEGQIINFIKKKINDLIVIHYFSVSEDNIKTSVFIKNAINLYLTEILAGKTPDNDEVIAQSVCLVSSYNLLSYIKNNNSKLYGMIVKLLGTEKVDTAIDMDNVGF